MLLASRRESATVARLEIVVIAISVISVTVIARFVVPLIIFVLSSASVVVLIIALVVGTPSVAIVFSQLFTVARDFEPINNRLITESCG